jgi:prevent-host-death family protein
MAGMVTPSIPAGESMPMAEARARLSDLVDRVRRTRLPVTLTRNGKPAAVLVDPEEWALVSELADRVEDEIDARAYAEAKREPAEPPVPFAQVLAELGEDELLADWQHRQAGEAHRAAG